MTNTESSMNLDRAWLRCDMSCPTIADITGVSGSPKAKEMRRVIGLVNYAIYHTIASRVGLSKERRVLPTPYDIDRILEQYDNFLAEEGFEVTEAIVATHHILARVFELQSLKPKTQHLFARQISSIVLAIIDMSSSWPLTDWCPEHIVLTPVLMQVLEATRHNVLLFDRQ